ncbi:MAG: hypothetical protein ACK5L6_13950 [Anaerorhabdus sp.]|uniref:hypothetical protein n=1 Tax=Anaerorhabdus sp. TaxID=1872524 RepID=UPI003A8A0DDB
MLKAKRTIPSETFNDGILSILNAKDGVITSNKYKETLRFGIKTVGFSRFFGAEVAGTKIEQLISVPFNTLIHQDDLIETRSFQTGEINVYRIKLMQPKDTVPRSIYLTLAKDGIAYTDNRKDTDNLR